MIANLKPYADYKDSGIAWMPLLPATWKTERAKWLFTKMARPVRSEDEVVTCFRDGMVTLRKNRRLRGFTEATVESGYQGIRKGDLVIHGMDAFAGAIGVSDSDGKSTPVYNVCQPKPGINARYYAHLVREMSQSQWILALAKGIRERSTDFRYEMFGKQRVPLPPPAEQAAIVRFLDWANGRLERTIRAKRKVIALLNEQKQAIIHRAVTRGLDPDVPLKPSGIPWLGDIPQHWEVRRLKSLGTKFGSGVTPRGGASVYQDFGVPLLRSQNIHFGDLRLDKVAFISKDIHEAMTGTHVKPGDVLLNITGASIGRVCAVPSDVKEANVNQHVCIIRPIRTLCDAEYLAMFLATEASQTAIYNAQNGSSREGLAVSKVKALVIVLPPLVEQRVIGDGIQRETKGVRIAISRLEREIELLREYRIRLVADIVTGKLDVREAAARLPDGAISEPIAETPDLMDEAEVLDEESAT